MRTYTYEKIIFDCEAIKILDIFVNDCEAVGVNAHWHRSIELLVPIVGALILDDDGCEYEVLPGSMYVINSRHSHTIHFKEGHKVYRGYALQIDYEYLVGRMPRLNHCRFAQPTEKQMQMFLEVIFILIHLYHSQLTYKSILLKGQVDVLIGMMFEFLLVPSTMLKHECHSFLSQVVDYMDDHASEDLGATDIAEHFGVSYGYLAKRFKENFDCTLTDYLGQVRMKQAMDDLMHTDLSVTDIALNNGFPNVKSFHALFKKYYKTTPSKYRQKMR